MRSLGSRASNAIGDDRTAFALALVIWLFTTVVAVVVAMQRGRWFPWSDEWKDIVPALTGDQPVTLRWLWSEHNGHRILLPRLVYIALYRLVNGDLRAIILVNVAALSGLALAAIIAAGRMRGRTSYVDVIFPLVLLAPHLPVFYWAFHLQFTSSAVLAGAILLLMTRNHGEISIREGSIVACCVLLLSLCGLNGVVMVPAFAAWLSLRVIRWLPSRRRVERLTAIAILVACLVAVCLVGSYFYEYGDLTRGQFSAGPVATVSTAARFLTTMFGPSVSGRWETAWPVFGILTLSLLSLAVGLLVADWQRSDPTRRRVLTYGSFFLAVGVLALAIGRGRGARGWDAGIALHYSVLTVPVVLGLILLIQSSRRQRLLRAVSVGLMVFFAGAYADGLRMAWLSEPPRREWAAFERELQMGHRAETIADKHIDILYFTETPALRELVARGIDGLRRAGIGRFAVDRGD